MSLGCKHPLLREAMWTGSPLGDGTGNGAAPSGAHPEPVHA